MTTLEGYVEKKVDHSRANEYLELNKAGGEYFKRKPGNPELPDGWEKKDHIKTGSNYKGVLYENENGEYALVNLGTDVWSPKDWGANAEMANGDPNKQCKDAVDYYNKNITQKKIHPEKVTIIGNSEGARETVEIIKQTDAEKGVTFNGFLKVDEKEYPSEKFEHLVNYRTKDDIISKCGKTIGTDFIVPTKEDVDLKPVYKVMQAHRIDNIGEITDETAIPAKDYEKITGERFKNKYGEGTLKSYEVGEIPKELYPWVDPDVNEKLAKGEVENAILNETKYNTYESQPDVRPLTIDNFSDERPDSDYQQNFPSDNNIHFESDLKKQVHKPVINRRISEKTVFVWVSEGESCEICEDLDGTIFENEDEIPGIPHPNCDCHVEEIPLNKNDNDDEEDEEEDEEESEEDGEAEDIPKKNKKRILFGRTTVFSEKESPIDIRMSLVPEKYHGIDHKTVFVSEKDSSTVTTMSFLPKNNEKKGPKTVFVPKSKNDEKYNRYLRSPNVSEGYRTVFVPESSETYSNNGCFGIPKGKKYWHEVIFMLKPKVRENLENRVFGLPRILRYFK